MGVDKNRKRDGLDGYVIVEAAVLLPVASVLLLLLVYLCSHLYQGCFMTQAAYVAAFRGSRQVSGGEMYVQAQLDEILAGEALSFEEEKRKVGMGMFCVSVSLGKNTPLSRLWGDDFLLSVYQKSAVRNPVVYIRGIRALTNAEWED